MLPSVGISICVIVGCVAVSVLLLIRRGVLEIVLDVFAESLHGLEPPFSQFFLQIRRARASRRFLL